MLNAEKRPAKTGAHLATHMLSSSFHMFLISVNLLNYYLFLALLSESDDNSVEKQYRNHSEKHHHISGEPSPYLKPALTTEEVKMRCDKSYTDDGISNRRKYLAVAVLFFINLLNYMDRFTIAGECFFLHRFTS